MTALRHAERAYYLNSPTTSLEPIPENTEDWIQALCGKYRDVLTPTEQLFREKQKEIELEEYKLRKHHISTRFFGKPPNQYEKTLA